MAVDTAWGEDNQWGQANDRRMLNGIKLLIEDALPDPGAGRGQPERLKHRAGDVWSRRINQEHRLVYRVFENDLVILQARFHYDD